MSIKGGRMAARNNSPLHLRRLSHPIRGRRVERIAMDILYLLIPLSVLAMLGVLAIFAWALHGGQFDDLDVEAGRFLLDQDQTER